MVAPRRRSRSGSSESWPDCARHHRHSTVCGRPGNGAPLPEHLSEPRRLCLPTRRARRRPAGSQSVGDTRPFPCCPPGAGGGRYRTVAVGRHRLIVTGGLCALGPIVLWFVLQVAGATIPIVAAAIVSCIAVPLGLAFVVLGTAPPRLRASPSCPGRRGIVRRPRRTQPRRRSRDRRGSPHHVPGHPGLGGTALVEGPSGGEGRGATPWDALAGLGEELGVAELVELATTVQLAGTEGARIRQALTARGASLRRHKQAEAESAANAMTERLFFPGALLLLGFLLFIGYPAIQRILGGF